ncbi:FAD-dependent oxidoreductase [Roseivirga sp.]|uniref:FAD-dependent oxidoreductase n=1 Tax=Roseivirga sp. TaxID=1964215 RepID=UPI003B8BAAE3
MKRRKFIKLTSLATLPIILQSCDWSEDTNGFPITVHTDIHTGHLIFKSQGFEKGDSISVETAIVGGGIAGLSAAYSLKDRDFMLLELSEKLGGTSSFSALGNTTFAQGAHYDLAYPSNYGDEVLSLLEELKVIEFQPWKDSWSFSDKQYLISNARKNICFEQGRFRGDVLVEGEEKEKFHQILKPFYGQMLMPSTMIDEKHSVLNEVSFFDYLNDRMNISDRFKRGLDYHMLDDWGGTTEQVSALAGIHYFTCRPYNTQVVDLFSPPSGNGYFIDKMRDQLPNDRLLTSHLVKSVEKVADGFLTEVIDIENNLVKTISSKNIIYAGQKHALKYIMPDQYELFQNTEYAPWLVLNFVMKDGIEKKGYWQNEMLTDDETFMGFVDSDMQETNDSDKRVLTAYYCLPSSSRNDLKNVEANREVIVSKTLGYLNEYFEKDLTDLVEHVFIKVMGHAMPIPKPNYLFSDKNENRLYENMTFAGVDNARLPLLFEAMDSGIQAARLLGDMDC